MSRGIARRHLQSARGALDAAWPAFEALITEPPSGLNARAAERAAERIAAAAAPLLLQAGVRREARQTHAWRAVLWRVVEQRYAGEHKFELAAELHYRGRAATKKDVVAEGYSSPFALVSLHALSRLLQRHASTSQSMIDLALRDLAIWAPLLHRVAQRRYFGNQYVGRKQDGSSCFPIAVPISTGGLFLGYARLTAKSRALGGVVEPDLLLDLATYVPADGLAYQQADFAAACSDVAKILGPDRLKDLSLHHDHGDARDVEVALLEPLSWLVEPNGGDRRLSRILSASPSARDSKAALGLLRTLTPGKSGK